MATQVDVRNRNELLDRILKYLELLVPFVSPIVAIAAIYYLYNYGNDVLSLRENRADLSLFTFALMWIALTSSWNLIGGYAGYVDFGHTLFVGIGSYAVANMMWSSAYEELALDTNLTFYQSLPVAFVVGALFAGLVGWPTLRLKGPYFAIAMLGLFVAVREMSNTLPDLTRGGRGIPFRPPFADPIDVYQTMLGLAGGIFFISLWIYRSQLGKMLQAIREDEVGADMRGINTTAIKIGIFMLAGGLTAMVGATRAWWQTYIDPSTVYPPDYTITIIMMTMLGGLGRPWGPVIGAAVFYYAQTTIWAELGSITLLITGIFLIVLVLFVPRGILGFFDPEDRGLRWQIHKLRLWLAGGDETALPSETHPIPRPAEWARGASYRVLPKSVTDFLEEHEFETIVSLIFYPIAIIVLGLLYLSWQDNIDAILPDFLFGLSAGQFFLVLIGLYILYVFVRAVIDAITHAQPQPVVTENEILLEGKGVTKNFGGLTAVNHVDFNVRAGEIVGLLGPNGSGKTTLFNCISGVLPITEGEVYLAGQQISKKAPWQINRLGLARTFQKIRVYDNLPVYENMLLARRWAGVPPVLWLWIAPPYVRREADELLEFLLLERVRHNLGRNLSGGQQRLLEIGMSLMSNPHIVLLDEATSGVNPALIEEIKATIRRLNEERGVTFLLIEHNMNFIMDLCSRLYVLDYGTRIAEGLPEEIQDDQRVIEAYFGRED